MAVKLSDAILWVVFLAIASTPIYSILEVIALMNGTLTSQSQAVTPGAIKGIKDLLLVLALGLTLIVLIDRCKLKLSSLVSLFIFISLLVLCISYSLLSGTPILLALAGIRWSLPLTFIFLLYNVLTERFMVKVAKLLKILFFLHFIVQFIQLFFAPPWFGVGMFGLSLRNPGLFLIPSTGAIFSICCFIFVMSFLKVNKLFYCGVTFLSVVLTMSGTGVVCFIFLIFLLILFRYMNAIASLVVASSAIIGVTPFLLWLSSLGRGDNYTEKSGGTRIELFIEAFYSSSPLSSHFGSGTNIANILVKSTELDNVFITDSMYTSVLVNLGYIGLFFYLLLLTYIFYRGLTKNDKTMILVGMFMVLMSLTIVWTEAFPISILIACLLAYLISPKKVLEYTQPRVIFYKKD